MCTNFKLTSSGGDVVIARTMEFPDMLGAQVTVIPRDTAFTSSSPTGAGHSWKSTYGVVGMDAVGNPQYVTDGMNEAGLYAGVLYMPGFAEYQDPTSVPEQSCISNMDICCFALTSCATVPEVISTLSELTIWGQPQGVIGGVPPIHLVLHDKQGNSAVLEFKNGEQSPQLNPIGVATNAPYLDWHLNNLRVHIPTLHALNPAPIDINGQTLSPVSQGQGFMGLPGDGSSASRFLRAASYVMTMKPQESAADQEMAAFHALNNFDIPDGVMAGIGATGQEQNDRTTWSSLSSLNAGRYIIRVESNPSPYVIDLGNTDFSPGLARQKAVPAGGFIPLSL